MGLSAAAVRARAEQGGAPVSWSQWQGYLKAGLLISPADGDWPAESVDRLVEIVELGRTVRSLSRRLLLLRRNYIRFPIPAWAVRQAMLALIPKIEQPATKWRRVHQACEWWAWQQTHPSKEERFRPRPLRLSPARWSALLSEFEPDWQAPRITSAYFFAGDVLPPVVHGTAYEVADLPFEELVTLVLVRDLAFVSEERQRFAEGGSRLWQR